jgi:hypothetical protein
MGLFLLSLVHAIGGEAAMPTSPSSRDAVTGAPLDTTLPVRHLPTDTDPRTYPAILHKSYPARAVGPSGHAHVAQGYDLGHEWSNAFEQFIGDAVPATIARERLRRREWYLLPGVWDWMYGQPTRFTTMQIDVVMARMYGSPEEALARHYEISLRTIRQWVDRCRTAVLGEYLQGRID